MVSQVKTAFIVLVALLIVVLGIAASAAVLFFRGGISARVAPTPLEVDLARRLRRLGIDGPARNLKNPLPRSAEVVHSGMAHFADHCAICHANDGSGLTEMGSNLYPRAPDLRSSDTQGLTDGELLYIIEQGVRLTGMPAWGDGSEESRRGSWALVHFIRHLPALSAVERLEMKSLNPKTREEMQEEEDERRFLQHGTKGRPDAGHRH